MGRYNISYYTCEECGKLGEELDDIFKDKDYVHTLYECKKCNKYYFVKDLTKMLDDTSTKNKGAIINPAELLAVVIGILLGVGLFIHYYLDVSVFIYTSIILIIFVISFLMYFIPWIIVQFLEELFK